MSNPLLSETLPGPAPATASLTFCICSYTAADFPVAGPGGDSPSAGNWCGPWPGTLHCSQGHCYSVYEAVRFLLPGFWAAPTLGQSQPESIGAMHRRDPRSPGRAWKTRPLKHTFPGLCLWASLGTTHFSVTGTVAHSGKLASGLSFSLFWFESYSQLW